MKLISRASIFLFIFTIFTVFTVSTTEAATIGKPSNYLGLNNGLVGWWTLDGKDVNWATGRVVDKSGNVNTGVVVGMATSTSSVGGVVGQALNFNATNQCVNFGTPSSLVNLTRPISISLWIKTPNTAQGGIILSLDTNDADTDTVVAINGAAGLYMGGSSHRATAPYTSTTFPQNKWNHVVLTYDSSGNSIIYINGSSMALGAADYFVSDGNTVGARTTACSGYPFLGAIDDVRIYNRALSADEIRLLYNLGSTKTGATVKKPIDTGLVGHWTFDGKDMNWGTNRALDRSGYGQNGIIFGMSTTTSIDGGVIGQALKFDGSDDEVAGIGPNATLDNMTSMTLSAWIRPTGPPSDGSAAMILNKHCNSAGTPGWYFAYYPSGASFVFVRNTTGAVKTYKYAANGTISQNVWTHVTATWDGSRSSQGIRLYKNGVEVADGQVSEGDSDPDDDSPYDIEIGNGSCYASHFKGFIDDARVYNRVLNSAEVMQLYSQSALTKVASTQKTPLSRGLIGHWTFDGKDVNWATGRVTDRSGNGNTGIVSGMATSTSGVGGVVGQGFRFDGNNDMVSADGTIATELNGSSEATISFWMKWEGGGILLSRWGSERQLTVYPFTTSALRVNWRVGGSGQGGEVIDHVGNAHSSLLINSWHHIALVYKDPVSYIYIDGALNSSMTGPGGALNTGVTDPLRIGNYSTNYFMGIFDDVRLYKKALTAEEIRSLYNHQR